MICIYSWLFKIFAPSKMEFFDAPEGMRNLSSFIQIKLIF